MFVCFISFLQELASSTFSQWCFSVSYWKDNVSELYQVPMTVDCLITLATVWRISWWWLCLLPDVVPNSFFQTKPPISTFCENCTSHCHYFVPPAPKHRAIIDSEWTVVWVCRGLSWLALKVLHPGNLFSPGKSRRVEKPILSIFLFIFLAIRAVESTRISVLQWHGEFSAGSLRSWGLSSAHRCGMYGLTVFSKNWIWMFAVDLPIPCCFICGPSTHLC